MAQPTQEFTRTRECTVFTDNPRGLSVVDFGKILLPILQKDLCGSLLFHQLIMHKNEALPRDRVMATVFNVERIRGEDLGTLVSQAGDNISCGFPDDSDGVYVYRKDLSLSGEYGIWRISGNGALWLSYGPEGVATRVTLSDFPNPGDANSHGVIYCTKSSPRYANVRLFGPEPIGTLRACLDKTGLKAFNEVYDALCEHFSKPAK